MTRTRGADPLGPRGLTRAGGHRKIQRSGVNLHTNLHSDITTKAGHRH